MKVQTAKVELYGLGKGTLRLTEFGAVALADGAVVRVPVELAQHLVLTHQSHVRVVNGDINSIPVEVVEVADSWRYEVLSGSTPNPVDTSTKGKAEPTKAGKATNRSMAGRVETKSDDVD